MPSLFDDAAFTRSLFFARETQSSPPPGALDLRVEVGPGVALHARWHRGASERPVVLLFHGNGEVVADYDRLAPLYGSRVGVDLAVVDYRGYGSSGGQPTLRSCLADAPRVTEALLGKIGERALVIMGRSLGGACAAELCRERRAAVAGYIFESAPSDLEALVRRRGVDLAGPLPEEDLENFCPLRKERRCTTPALVLHGEDDTIIAASEALATHEALAGEKWLTMIEGRGHNDLMMSPAYWGAMAAFVARVAR